MEKNNLLGLAEKIAPSGFEGGISKEDTDKHLAWRYNGSCARVLLSVLDPKHKLSDVSDAYASIFAGNKVFLSDLPSGSGAAIVSILCTLFELRKHNVLPRHPLNISIIAGEISPTAKIYLKEQLENLTPFLEEQAIWIEFEIVEWDTLSKISTVDLIRKITISSQHSTAKLLILSNFTGFLVNSGKWEKAKPQFDDIFLHSRDLLSTLIWIEPQRKNVVNFFKRAIEWLKVSFSPLLGSKLTRDDSSWYAQADIFCKQPIKDGYFLVRLTVMRFDLPLEVQK
ncbi:MAG: hypothetical protein D8M57_06305 [Candidatus Scalindua sp. AMX11]|nr:MAG: hypothetical protein DWQ00_14090 [Candidatus Scalindua sp.]NOG85423.1 hypothetical protein [Planctomycetota bacterium]RZV84016.1 MAG: hypothetical protein EX341_08780 [Candidatus Scalindua sp. SCAELEC01]TDE65699.1 MAG: hypothetical protein D8M57_06305 [Candidatus Scalindua sp. AMX11]GJQ58814.1 MAG: hypothetical protein SCALA701_16150 [Candidatus Scalindua sp.]